MWKQLCINTIPSSFFLWPKHFSAAKSAPPFMTSTANSSPKCRNVDQRKGEKHSPFLLPPKAPPIRTVPFFSLKNAQVFVSCFGKILQVSGLSAPQTRVPVLTPLFPCSRRQIFLESWELSKTGPHTVFEHSTAGGRQTYTHTHSHTLTKWRLWQKFLLPQKLLMNLITTLLLSAFTDTSCTCCVGI